MDLIRDILNCAGNRAMEECAIQKEEANLKVAMAEYKRIMDTAEDIHVKANYMMVFLTGVIAALSLLIPTYIEILSNVAIPQYVRWIGFSLMLAAGILCLVTFNLALRVYEPKDWQVYQSGNLRMADCKHERYSAHLAMIVGTYLECIDGPPKKEPRGAKPVKSNREIMKMTSYRFHLTRGFLAGAVILLVANIVFLLVIYAPIQ